MNTAGTDCVLGLDVGGTSTRVAAVDLSGRRLAVGTAGGGNPVSHGREAAVRNVADAVAQVLVSVAPERVGAVVMGIAGVTTLRDDAGDPLFDQVWRQAGLHCPVRLVADAVVAFTAGTPEPSGTVLIAGTGAIATAIDDRDLAGRRSDGYGWLLGDLGSGFWLGRQAVSATLRHLDGIGPGGRLVEAVVEAVVPGTAPTVNQVIQSVMSTEPVRLSRFAPLVTQAAEVGDPVAVDLVDRAVEHLVTSVDKVHTADGRPVVLAGSLAGGDTPVSRGVRERLTERFPDTPIRVAHDGAAGAAWLAAHRMLPGDTDRLAALHRELFGG
ncbi:N-acetylglucosamine kinase-like BadF-type ATPase [Stackebrandtia albiflava]|uniref:N-acetylglucosamine kinase-like BadF-type ATPase n=1 Tax=Stackebrandtia albiflava TaxID=406432 RepID=A0A562VBR5_9ACTN|nr:BadF/BadG/BcrA/BcrD ATPase family protein [Stackebrandtia albiflava]TWJ15319.1 N-acetylglucosamine kinase-like BadF-type ATPase [Stackebrandtia albiflava]